MTQNIYGLTRNTRPRGVQYILSGSKQFRKNGGPHLKGSRRPRKKVAIGLCSLGGLKLYFSEPKRIFFFFFSRRRLVMVFGGQITFSTPPQKISAPKIFFRPPIFFFRRFFFFSAPKTKKRLFRRAPKEQYCPSGKTSFSFFFGAASLWCSAAK